MTLEYSVDPESIQRALAEMRRRSDELGWGGSEQRPRYTDQVLQMRRQRIERAADKLIDSCSAMYRSDTGDPTFKPVAWDLEYAVWLLLQARSGKIGPGRPHSPRVNGPRLRELRREAGMTQAGLVDSVNRYDPARPAALNLKSLRRYEQSQPGDPERLAVIAAVLMQRLSRPVTVEDITF
jgi:hypothetical protein